MFSRKSYANIPTFQSIVIFSIYGETPKTITRMFCRATSFFSSNSFKGGSSAVFSPLPRHKCLCEQLKPSLQHIADKSSTRQRRGTFLSLYALLNCGTDFYRMQQMAKSYMNYKSHQISSKKKNRHELQDLLKEVIFCASYTTALCSNTLPDSIYYLLSRNY